MELAYRSFLPKLRVELLFFEGGPVPPKYAIKSECDDAFNVTKNYREMGENLGLEGSGDRQKLQSIRKKLVNAISGDDKMSMARMAKLLPIMP